MKDSNHINAINTLIDSIQLNDKEIEELYSLLGREEIDVFFDKIEEFGKSLPENADEIALLKWLKTLSENSPIIYDSLQKIIRENKKLFDKIQEIFIEKIL